MNGPMYNGHSSDDLYDKAAFSADISNRMQVPKSIRVGGESLLHWCFFSIFHLYVLYDYYFLGVHL